jgi:DNA-binding transcriptional LysR family regulator
MSEVKLQHLDLHLLRVFLALFEEQSVTRAAARLNITPSAISHSLSRLRIFFDDDLFVRRAFGMQPTARATDIGPRVRSAMLQLEQAIRPSRFDPAESTRRFVLSLPPYICRLLLPPLMNRFCVEAPGAEIRVRPRSRTLAEDFDAGQVDLAILPMDRVGDEYSSEPIFMDEWVWAIPKDHPFAQGTLTIEKLAGISHLVVSGRREAMLESGATDITGLHPMNDSGALEAALSAKKLDRKVSLNVPDSMTALAVAAQCGHATMVPRRLVEEMADFYGLRLFPPPYPAPKIQTIMAWRHESDTEPGAIWFRELVRRAADQLPDLAPLGSQPEMAIASSR